MPLNKETKPNQTYLQRQLAVSTQIFWLLTFQLQIILLWMFRLHFDFNDKNDVVDIIWNKVQS